jgi:hypothetical protein
VPVDLANARAIEHWLDTEPIAVARIFAARIALRVLPLLVGVTSVGHQRTMYHEDARQMAIATFGALIPAWGTENIDITLEEKAFRVALDHIRSKYSGGGGGAFGAGGAAVGVGGSASPDLHLEAVTNAISSAVDVATAASQNRSKSDIIKLVLREIRLATIAYPASSPSYSEIAINPPVNLDDLVKAPLWRAEPPYRASTSWTYLQRTMRNSDKDWSPWIDWYNGRVQGRTSDGKLEKILSELPKEIWQRDLASINVEMHRAISLPQEDPPPSIPNPGPASTFIITEQGFDLSGGSPTELERTDKLQKSLHERIKTRLNQLGDVVGSSNQHLSLALEFNDYMRFLDVDLAELDVPSVWSTGNGLAAYVEALSNPQPGVMTEPLEPEIIANLRALTLDHIAFISGFAIGRELMSRVQTIHQMNRPLDEIKRITGDVLRPMLSTRRLLGDKARSLIASLARAFDDLDIKAVTLLSSGSETARNSLIAFGRAVHPIVVLTEGAAMIAILAGSPYPQILTTSLLFIRDNADAIMAFAASDPELSQWLVWLIERSNKFLREFGDAI